MRRTTCVGAVGTIVVLAAVSSAPAGWHEAQRGTHADYHQFVAPDGVTYPDFTFAGIHGGIPDMAAPQWPVFNVVEHGADPADNGQDDTAAIQKAIDAAVAAGGGIVYLPEGHYSVSSSGAPRAALTIRNEGRNITRNVVMRGDGRRRTILHLESAHPDNATIAIVGGGSSGRGSALARDARPGDTAVYVKRSFTDGGRDYNLIDTNNYKEGDLLLIEVNSGSRADENDVPWDLGRTWIVYPQLRREDRYAAFINELVAIEDLGAEADQIRLTLRQPLRLPMRAGSSLYERGSVMEPYPHASITPANNMLRRCGIEEMTLTYSDQARNADRKWGNNLGCNGVQMTWAFECWMRAVEIVRPGRFPLFTSNVKFAHIHDVQYAGVEHWNRGGGTGYGGWTAWGGFVEDSLMDYVESEGMRHDPNIQGQVSGNVIRNGRIFYASKQDYHNGPAIYNLVETTLLEQTRKAGGMFRSAQITSTIHSQPGPGNVSFNNDYFCQREGMYIGGMIDDWIFNYNRVYVELDNGGNGAFWPIILFYDNVNNFLFKGNIFISPNREGNGAIHYLPRFPEQMGRTAMRERHGRDFYQRDHELDQWYRQERELPQGESPYNQSRDIQFIHNTFFGFPREAFFADPFPNDTGRPNGERFNRFDRNDPPHNADFFEVNTIVESLPHESMQELRTWPDVASWPRSEPFAPSLYAWQYETKYGEAPWSPAPPEGPWNLPAREPAAGTAVNKEMIHVPYVAEAFVAKTGRISSFWEHVETTYDASTTPNGLKIAVAKPGETIDPQNLSGEFKAAWNDQALFIWAAVTDDVLRDDGRGAWWEVDCVELYLDGSNSKSREYDGTSDVQIGLLPIRGRAIVQKGPSSSVRPVINANTRSSPSGYTLEAAIPWEVFGFGGLGTLQLQPGIEIGINLVISDNDRGGGRQRRLSWVNDFDEGGGDMSHWNPSVFGTLRLMPRDE
jgi:hypothetical protein